MPIVKARADQPIKEGKYEMPDYDAFVTAWNAKNADKDKPVALRGLLIPVTFLLAQGGVATTGVSKTAAVVIPTGCMLVKAFIYAKTAPTGADFIVDVNKNGTTIWSTQGNRLKLVAGATTGNQITFNTSTFVEGDVLTIDIDQIGSGVSGQDVTVILLMRTM